MTVRRPEGAVLAGWYEEPIRRTTEQSTRDLLIRAVDGALRHAGVERSAVDGFVASGFTLAPDNTVDLAVACGLDVGWLATPEPGGTGGLGGLAAACEAVVSGAASVVVIAAADKTGTSSLAEVNAEFSTVVARTQEPVGAAAANITFGFLQEQYLRRYKLDRSALGSIAVAQRRNGAANPRAIFRDELTMEDYLNARPIAAPIHLYDCVLPACGAAAVVVTRAQDAAQQRVHVRSFMLNYRRTRPDPLEFGWAGERDELYAAAGVEPSDISGAQIYDDYPVMVARQLEELGLAAPGQANLLAERGFGPTDQLPVNTSGGILSSGQAGSAAGYLPIIEAARQLSGQADGRQIPNATTQLVSALGMVGYTGPQSFAAAILAIEGDAR